MQVLKFLLDFFTKKSRVQGGALPLPAQGQKQMDSFRSCKQQKAKRGRPPHLQCFGTAPHLFKKYSVVSFRPALALLLPFPLLGSRFHRYGHCLCHTHQYAHRPSVSRHVRFLPSAQSAQCIRRAARTGRKSVQLPLDSPLSVSYFQMEQISN